MATPDLLDVAAEQRLQAALSGLPRARSAQVPTPIEALSNLGESIGADLYVKRDDCTGFSFGGNKVRQLEFYFGEALEQGADTILITGAVQSNFVRTAATMACRYRMKCHIQLEDRVDSESRHYHNNGNVLLDRLLGATLHYFAREGDEVAADRSLNAIASDLKAQGQKPYIIHLGSDAPPIGALGYVCAALEYAEQIRDGNAFDHIYVPSGSAQTHVGLLFGLRALGLQTPVTGICVRRSASEQQTRVRKRVADLAELLNMENPVEPADIVLEDSMLAPGYGQAGPEALEAVQLSAREEGLFLDPVYSGKTMAALIAHVRSGELANKKLLFWHTGGLAALFAYGDVLGVMPDEA